MYPFGTFSKIFGASIDYKISNKVSGAASF